MIFVLIGNLSEQITEKSSNVEASESESDEGAPFDEIALYEQILVLMQEKETVAKALQRLGNILVSVTIFFNCLKLAE